MNKQLQRRHDSSAKFVSPAWRIAFLITVLIGQVSMAQGEMPGSDNSQTVYSGEYGYQNSQSTEFGGVQVDTDVNAGGSGSLNVGDNGVQGEFELGVQANVDAEYDLGGIGDDQFGADASVRADLEAALGASGVFGAYIDDTGITIGAEAEAGAYISAGIELDMDVRVFGVETNVKVRAEAAAGVQASAEAMVHIGFDGEVDFSLGAGLVVGIGAQFGIEFSLNTESLMRALGLGDDMLALAEWVARFQADPEAYLGDLIDSVGNAALNQLTFGLFGRTYDAGASFGAPIYVTPNRPAVSAYRPPPRNPDQQVNTPANLQLTPYESPGPYQWPAPLSW